nr:DUF5677 domain-containing protein [uncultured Allomuricauda sp.]
MNKEDKILTLLKEANSITLPNLQESLELILKGHAEVLQSIYESKPKLEEGEVFIETLIMKIIFASKSVLDLSNGSEFITYKGDKKLDIIDTPSIYVLTRSIIEAFLTLEYLYFNELELEERLFRYNLWRVSGFMTRQNHLGKLQKKHAEKQEREKKLIAEIKLKIKESKFYSSLAKQQTWKLDKYGLPRLISWIELLNQSRLKSRFFLNIYRLYSNYAHSEYLSMIQINEGSLNKNAPFNISTTESSLNNIRMINSMTILLLKERFGCTASAYKNLDEKLRFTIEFWEKIAKE